jgi:hypothetical protein
MCSAGKRSFRVRGPEGREYLLGQRRGRVGRVGPLPREAAELKRIEVALRSDPNCNVFASNLRNCYISVKSEDEVMRIAQVRDEEAPNRRH